MPLFATPTAQTLTGSVVDVEFSISIRRENNWATAHRGKAVSAVFIVGERRRRGFYRPEEYPVQWLSQGQTTGLPF